MQNPEITIIGAGSTGLSAAIFLNQNGFQSTIYEKRERAKINKAIGINPVTLQLFNDLGITDRFLQNGRKMEKINFWLNHERVYVNDFAKVNHPFPYMVIQPQHETEAILEEYLNEKGIYVNRNWDLVQISQNQSHIDLSLQNVDNHEIKNNHTNGLVLGADGSKSAVRELLNHKFEGWEHPDVYELFDIELETDLDRSEGHYMFFREGAMMVTRLKDNIWRVGGNLQDILNYLPKGTKTGKIDWQTTFTIKEMIAETYSQGNIHLLGDAAHVHSPLGGRGMNMCIEDAYVFSQLLKDNRLNEYSKLRRDIVKRNVGILGKLTTVVGGNNFVGRNVRLQMKNFNFVFPIVMPWVRKFLLGLN